MKKRKVKTYVSMFINNLSSLIVIAIIFVVFAFYNKNPLYQTVATAVFIPFMLTMIAFGINKFNDFNKTFIDLKICNFDYIKKSNVKYCWGNNNKLNINENDIFIAIENIGEVIISSFYIILNPANTKKDMKYEVFFPLKKDEMQCFVVPNNLKLEELCCVSVVYHFNAIDDAVCFDGNLLQIDGFRIFSEINKNVKVKFKKKNVSNCHRIAI